MKEYRVDTFEKAHKKQYFDSETKATEYGKAQAKKGKIAFLLKSKRDDIYDIVAQLK